MRVPFYEPQIHNTCLPPNLMRVAARVTVVLRRTHHGFSLDLKDFLGRYRGVSLARAMGRRFLENFMSYLNPLFSINVHC